MRRKIERRLLEWESSPQRKPLLLNGARQVGTTHILEWFGQTFEGDLKPPRITDGEHHQEAQNPDSAHHLRDKMTI